MRNPGLFFSALLVFLVSTAGTILALEWGSRALAVVATIGMAAAAVLFLLSLWRPRRHVDWDRVRAEQRLWESGPLGRSWLRVRQRLSDLWKF